MQAAVDDQQVVEGGVRGFEGGRQGAGGVHAVEGDGETGLARQAYHPGEVFAAGDGVGVHEVGEAGGG